MYAGVGVGIVRWFVPIAMVCCVSTAEAAVTIADLNLQTQKTIAAQQAYTLAVDEFSGLTAQVHAAFNRWQSLRALAISYYSCGDYFRGDLYAVAAQVEQIEYDRLTALVPSKQAEVDSKKQAYLSEYARLNAMLDAYDRQ